MKIQQTTISEVKLVYRAKVKASTRLQLNAQRTHLTYLWRKDSCILMDIQLLDHLIIVPEGKYYSM
jgi:hypothetical protein